jgi:hypothetical protein
MRFSCCQQCLIKQERSSTGNTDSPASNEYSKACLIVLLLTKHVLLSCMYCRCAAWLWFAAAAAGRQHAGQQSRQLQHCGWLQRRLEQGALRFLWSQCDIIPACSQRLELL